MHLTLLAVGKLRPWYRQACDVYLRRLERYAKVAEREVREAKASSDAVQRREEAARLAALVPDGATLVALAIDGTRWSSEELARRVDGWRAGARPVAVMIGGAAGLSPDLLARADLRWSLGPLTLPHQLARVVVCEQLYRAFTILKGEPYHRP